MSSAVLLSILNFVTTEQQKSVLMASQPLVGTIMVHVTRNVATGGEEVFDQFFATYMDDDNKMYYC